MRRVMRVRIALLLKAIAAALIVGTSLAAYSQAGATLYEFTGGADGGRATAGLVADSAGNLYGTTFEYGAGPCTLGVPGCGTVFELSPAGTVWSYQVLYTFQGGEDGENPSSGLTFDQQGNIYGTTVVGGFYGCGTIFELKRSADGWQESILYPFTCGTDGGGPGGTLALDGEGNIFGTAAIGGDRNCGCGVAFELKKPSALNQQWKEIVLHAFVGTDGANPSSGVTLAPPQFCQGDSFGRGCIFGTTAAGGEVGLVTGGVVFELLPPATGSLWSFRDLYRFNFAAGRPGGPLVFDKSGTLYGMAGLEGTFGLGAVFQLKPIGPEGLGWRESNIYSFSGPPNGSFSLYQGVVLDEAGNLYGTTSSGGTSAECIGGCGTVFRLSRSGEEWYESALYSLPGGSGGGEDSYAGVVLDGGGNVYGTTPIGGDLNCSAWAPQSGCGVVFQVSP